MEKEHSTARRECGAVTEHAQIFDLYAMRGWPAASRGGPGEHLQVYLVAHRLTRLEGRSVNDEKLEYNNHFSLPDFQSASNSLGAPTD
jgi:hypothetical protein